jgi:hypothetical protein
VRNGRAGRLDQLAHLMSVLRAMSVATGFMAAHMGHGSTLHQSMPGPVMRIASRYEHLIMRSINFLAMRDFIYNNRSLKAMVDRVSGWVMSTVNGEVLSVDEAKEMAGAIAGAGFTVAAGTCPCRRARNELSDTVPNNTDMVFGEWADNYLKNYPGLYRKLDAEEAQVWVHPPGLRISSQGRRRIRDVQLRPVDLHTTARAEDEGLRRLPERQVEGTV